MKKIGEYTARGTISEQDTEAGLPEKIALFDGRFDTGYKVKEFYIWAVNYSGSSHPDCVGKLATNERASTASTEFMNANNNAEIAWAATAGSTDGGLGFAEGGVVDPDNLVVEDLYVYARHAGTTGPANYMVIMEKYEFNTWRGALAMSAERQGNVEP